MSLGNSRARLELAPIEAPAGAFILVPQGSVSATTSKNNGGGTQVGFSTGTYTGFIPPFSIPFKTSVSKILFNGAAGGIGSHLLDVGIYDLKGNLLASTGPTIIVNGTNDLPFLQGVVTFDPGIYLLAITAKTISTATITVEESQGPFIPYTTTAQCNTDGSLPAAIPVVVGTPLYGNGDPPDRPIMLLH